MEDYYDSISNGYEELYGAEQLDKARVILELIKPKKTDKLLDVGCGTGFFLELCDCDAIGIDPSVELLKRAKGKVVHGVAESLPFENDSFDFVISITAIHNFEDIDKAISEMKRVARGKVVISVLKNTTKLTKIDEKLRKTFKVEKLVLQEKDIIYLMHK